MKMVKVYVVIGYDNIDMPVVTRVSLNKIGAEIIKENLADQRDVAYACVHERLAVFSLLEVVDLSPGAEADVDDKGKETEKDKTL